MSSERDWAIRLDAVEKCYRRFPSSLARIKQLVFPARTYFSEHVALRGIDLSIGRGEVVGVVGRNGAGKSTLLQLVAGTLSPSAGACRVGGRVAALLELGSGFNPDFTGQENVYLNAAMLGLDRVQIDAAYDEIVAFSGIGESINQPVRTYSSGMTMRLAFSVATHVDPEILIIDEALSVGDGQFARASFERIMRFKDEGKTILFCSHSLYQVEALCGRAIWLDSGRLMADGQPADVIMAYDDFLASLEATAPSVPDLPGRRAVAPGTARIVALRGAADGTTGSRLKAESRVSDIALELEFAAAPDLPCPQVAFALVGVDGQFISSVGTHVDGVALTRDAAGTGRARVTFPALPLLKGNYWVSAFLLCERGIHIYDHVERGIEISVHHDHLEQGIVALPRVWG